MAGKGRKRRFILCPVCRSRDSLEIYGERVAGNIKNIYVHCMVCDKKMRRIITISDDGLQRGYWMFVKEINYPTKGQCDENN